MKTLNWTDSIVGLGEGKTIEDENVLLLWNMEDDQFHDLFMTNNIQHDKSPTTTEVRATRSASKNRGSPTRGTTKQAVVNLDQTTFSSSI